MVADLCVVGGYAQYAIRPARVPRARARRRRSGRSGLHPAGLSHRLPDAHPLPPAAAGRNDPRDRCLGHGRHGAARSGAAFWLKRDRHLLGREHGRGRELWRNGDRLSRRRLRRGGAQAHRRTTKRTRAAPASTPPSMRSAAPISLARSPASRPAGCSSATGRRPWRSGAKACSPQVLAWPGSSCGARSGSCSAAVARCGTASPRDERRTRRSSRPTWPHCSVCCATAPFIPSSSTACLWRPPARSMPASTPAGSAARSCCCPGPLRYRILVLPACGLVTHPFRSDKSAARGGARESSGAASGASPDPMISNLCRSFPPGDSSDQVVDSSDRHPDLWWR